MLKQTPALPWRVAGPCCFGGAALLALGMWKLSGLAQGGGGTKLAVGACLLALAGLCVGLLRLCGADRSLLLCALLPIGAAVFLRCCLLDHMTYDYRDFLSGWAAFFRDNGGWAALKLPKGNYNVPYLYFLAFISYLDLPDLYLIKLFSVLFDVLLAWGGARLVRVLTGDRGYRPLAAFCLLLLLPTVVLNGAYWAQCDSIYGALCLHALASGLDRRPKGAVVLLALAFSFKLQAVFLIPLWCALWFTRRVRFRELLLFPATYALSILPALLLGKPLGDILGVYFGQAVEYKDYLTLNAPSVYAFLPYGVEVDTERAARLGIVAAFAVLGLLLLALWLHRDRVTDSMLMTAGVIMAVGIPLFLPHMHDRYFFLADVLTLCWACVSLRRVPHAVGVQVASLGAYHAYLVLRYAFPMAVGALILLAVLVSSCVILWGEFERAGRRGAQGGRRG